MAALVSLVPTNLGYDMEGTGLMAPLGCVGLPGCPCPGTVSWSSVTCTRAPSMA